MVTRGFDVVAGAGRLGHRLPLTGSTQEGVEEAGHGAAVLAGATGSGGERGVDGEEPAGEGLRRWGGRGWGAKASRQGRGARGHDPEAGRSWGKWGDSGVRVFCGGWIREAGWAGLAALARFGRPGGVADWAGWVEAQWGKRGFFPSSYFYLLFCLSFSFLLF